MNKLILLVSLLLLGIIGGFQEYPENTRVSKLENFISNQGDSILWSRNRKLVWDDFKGKPNYDEIYSAVTNTYISSKIKGYNDSIIITAYTYLDKNKSYVKKEDISDLLLEHEQGHFDISEICVRKFRKGIKSRSYSNKELMLKDIQDSLKTIFVYKRKINDEYDNQTSLGAKIDKQKEWTAKINKMLDDLEAYSSPKVVIKRVGW